MYRKIIMNFLIGLLLPIALSIRWFPHVYNAFFKGIYKYYDFRIESLGEFLYHVYGRTYFIEYFVHLFVLFLPFQLIKDYYFNTKKIRLSFLKKWGVLTSILLVWMLLWVPLRLEYWRFFVFAIGFGLVFTALLYFTIDRYVEKIKEDHIA